MYKIQMKNGIAVCTTDSVPNHEVTECFGVVHGTCIYGANFMKDFFARARDTIGGRVNSYESTLDNAQEQAVAELIARAKALGANAVVGVRISIGTCGQTMMMANAYGTAVFVTAED